jgi:glycosyltransferase involved in cell wall biosynthesis
MKNLIIFYPSFERGGVEKIIENLIIHFKKKKINIFLISLKNKNLNKLKKIKNLKIINPKKNNFLFFLPNRLSSMINCLSSLIFLLQKLNKKNTVIHSMQSSFIPILISKLKKFKIVIRNSEDPISSTKYAENKLWAYLVFFLRFFFYNLPDLIITNSKGSALSLKKFLTNKNKLKVKTIYNPYLTEEKIKDSLKKKVKKNHVISVGRLCKQKNFETLIYAFKKFIKINKNYKLLIIGDGYQKNYLQNIIQNLGLNKSVFLVGYVKELSNYYKEAKLFVLPSLYEGFGNVLIDAINYLVPCISTNCKSGPAEILCNGKGGDLVPIKNVNLLSQKMTYVITNKDKSKKKIHFAKKNLFRFNLKVQSEKYFHALKSVLR